MRALGTRSPAWLLVVVAALSGACSKQDPQRLAGVGRKVGTKLKAELAMAQEKVALRWDANRANPNDLPLDHRVSVRLRWDSDLVGTKLSVRASGSTVELSGTVATIQQAQRARELTLSTVGVENVLENVTITPPPQ